MSILAEQLPIPEFDDSMQEVPLPSLDEYVQRQQAEAASFIHHQYNQLDESIDVAYAMANKKLKKTGTKIGLKVLKYTNPGEYRRQKNSRRYRTPINW